MSLFIPNRFITYLGCTFACMVLIYLSLVVTTVFLASAQTQLLSTVSDSQVSIGQLEAKYYNAIIAIDAMDPSELGLVAPVDKSFARADTAPGVALIEN